jgi:hypothetical protein
MGKQVSIKSNSRKDWGYPEGDFKLNTSEIITQGAIMRIADATEVMARSYNDLIRDRDNYKRYYSEQCDRVQKLHKTISALKGHITRLKNR